MRKGSHLILTPSVTESVETIGVHSTKARVASLCEAGALAWSGNQRTPIALYGVNHEALLGDTLWRRYYRWDRAV